MKINRQITVIIVCVFTLVSIGCNNSSNSNPSPTPTPIITPTPTPTSIGSYTVNGTTYTLTTSSGMYFNDNFDHSYYTGNTIPVNKSQLQIIQIDSNYISTTIADATSVNFTIDKNIGVLPSPTYGKCNLEIAENINEPNEIVWQPQTNGTLTISRNGNSYNYTCSNVVMENANNTSITTTASINYTITIQ